MVWNYNVTPDRAITGIISNKITVNVMKIDVTLYARFLRLTRWIDRQLFYEITSDMFLSREVYLCKTGWAPPVSWAAPLISQTMPATKSVILGTASDKKNY